MNVQSTWDSSPNQESFNLVEQTIQAGGRDIRPPARALIPGGSLCEAAPWSFQHPLSESRTAGCLHKVRDLPDVTSAWPELVSCTRSRAPKCTVVRLLLLCAEPDKTGGKVATRFSTFPETSSKPENSCVSFFLSSGMPHEPVCRAPSSCHIGTGTTVT